MQLSDFGPGYSGLYAPLCIYLFGTVCSATGVYIYENKFFGIIRHHSEVKSLACLTKTCSTGADVAGTEIPDELRLQG